MNNIFMLRRDHPSFPDALFGYTRMTRHYGVPTWRRKMWVLRRKWDLGDAPLGLHPPWGKGRVTLEIFRKQERNIR